MDYVPVIQYLGNGKFASNIYSYKEKQRVKRSMMGINNMVNIVRIEEVIGFLKNNKALLINPNLLYTNGISIVMYLALEGVPIRNIMLSSKFDNYCNLYESLEDKEETDIDERTYGYYKDNFSMTVSHRDKLFELAFHSIYYTYYNETIFSKRIKLAEEASKYKYMPAPILRYEIQITDKNGLIMYNKSYNNVTTDLDYEVLRINRVHNEVSDKIIKYLIDNHNENLVILDKESYNNFCSNNNLLTIGAKGNEIERLVKLLDTLKLKETNEECRQGYHYNNIRVFEEGVTQ